MRAILKQELSIEHKYNVIAEDIMTLERKDQETGQMRQYVVRPLNAIDEDFEKISEILEKTLTNLGQAKRRRSS